MQIVSVKSLVLPEIKVIRFGRFCDQRGYFAEPFRNSDFQNHPEMGFMKGVSFRQCNESYSSLDVVRGLHFQWNPFMGKLVRSIYGRMVDLVLDIRKGSPNFGKIIAYDMPSSPCNDYAEWIWVPPGFAHGNFFTEDTIIEYFCSGEYSPGCEAGISPLAKDLNWSLCDLPLKKLFDKLTAQTPVISDKDKNGFFLRDWEQDRRSDNFLFGKLHGERSGT